MSAAELLLKRLVEQAGGGAETGYVLVIDGEGLEDLPPQVPTPQATYRVHRARTELGLRHLLWQARGAPIIAVLPEELARRIRRAPDLLRRARNQRVHSLQVTDVLEVALGVRVVGAEPPWLQQLALDHVDQLTEQMRRRTLPTVVDRRLLTELLIDACVGEQVRSRAPSELLAGWVREPPRWGDDVRRLVQEALPSLHGDEGRLLAWALAEPETRLRDLVVHGALLTVEADELPKRAWGSLWAAAAQEPLAMDRRIVRRAAARLAEETLAALGEAAMKLLAAAEQLGRETLTPSLLATSRVLPLAFADRCHALARRAAASELVDAADLAWLTAHRAAPAHRAELAVIEAIARLARFLESRREDAPASARPLAHVLAYLRDGAFADVAVERLRRALAASAGFHAEAAGLIAAVRERRDADNRRFAETLAAGYEAALHAEGVTPLHRLWRLQVERLWEREPRAGVYLVVLDGCSYPVFLELLRALARDASDPVGIRPDAEGRVGGLPALAPLPTVTSHARGALFLGELPRDPLVAETVFRDQEEARTDKARFQQNARLGDRGRRLFLKGDLTDGGQALLAALVDPGVVVVAAVFNAVDDQITSSNTGSTVRLAPEDVTAFKPSLKAAFAAGRRVLVTADHGHSPFVDKSLRAGSGKAPRWTALSGGEGAAGEAPPEGFLEIDVGGLGGPPERRAFAWRTGVYLGQQQVGFHGGCSLEEMAVPLAWLEQGGLHADEPAWWFPRGALAAPEPPLRPASPPLVTPLPSDAPKPDAQLSLFDPDAKAASLPLPAAVLAALDKDQKAVLVLLAENGSARASELAERLAKNPGRLNGLMRALRRRLHAGGCMLFTDEVLPSGETLYRYQAPEARG